jgi:hypothetical protein
MESIGFTCKKKSFIANFHILGLFNYKIILERKKIRLSRGVAGAALPSCR